MTTTFRPPALPPGLPDKAPDEDTVTDAAARIKTTESVACQLGDYRQGEDLVDYSALLPELNPNPIIEVDLSGRVRYLNRAARRLFPELRNDGLGHPLLARLVSEADEQQQETRCALREVTVGGRRYEQTLSLRPDTHRVRIYSVDITEPGKAKEALKDSEEKYLAIIQTANEGIWQVDSEERIAFANRRMSEMLGYALEELVGKPVTLFLDEETRRAHPARLEERRRGKPGSHEGRLVGKDGSVVDVNVSAAPVTDGNGLYKGRVSVFTDLTDRKRAELEHQTILQTAMDGFFVADGKGRFTDANDAYCRLLGYSRQELLRMTVADVEAEENPEVVAGRLRRIRETGADRFETRHRARDGRAVDVESSVTYLRDRGAFFAFIHDISQRKQAEAALRESEQKYRLIFETAANLIVSVDEKGTLVDCNSQAKTLLGYDSGELIGQPMTWLIPADGLDAARASLQEALSGGTSYQKEYQMIRKDGAPINVSVNSSPLPYGGGGHQTVLCVIEDVTRRKEAEENLRASLRKIEETLDQTVQALSSTIELRDPYTAGHQRRVSILACAIAREMGLSDPQIDTIKKAGLVHDIGKMAIPADLLTSPRKLNEIEFSLMKMHCQSGYEILMTIPFFAHVAEITRQHHERLDGSGYPSGLVGEDILPEARIVAVADVVEAMASHRPYRPALGVLKALDEISKGAGIRYDREVVKACVALFTERGFTLE